MWLGPGDLCQWKSIRQGDAGWWTYLLPRTGEQRLRLPWSRFGSHSLWSAPHIWWHLPHHSRGTLHVYKVILLPKQKNDNKMISNLLFWTCFVNVSQKAFPSSRTHYLLLYLKPALAKHLFQLILLIQVYFIDSLTGDSWHGDRGAPGWRKTLSSAEHHKRGVLQDRSESRCFFLTSHN